MSFVAQRGLLIFFVVGIHYKATDKQKAALQKARAVRAANLLRKKVKANEDIKAQLSYQQATKKDLKK
jgi:hypothetical protein